MHNKQRTVLEEIEAELKNDEELRPFQKNLAAYNTAQSIINELIDNIDNNNDKIFYEKNSKESNQNKVKSDKWNEIRNSIDQEDFQVFYKSFYTFKTAQEVIGALNKYIGMRKSQTLGQRIFQKEKQPSIASQGKNECIQEIRKLIQDEVDFKQFQQKLNTFHSLDQLVQELSKHIGKKPAKKIGGKLYQKLKTKSQFDQPLEKNSKIAYSPMQYPILYEIEKKIGDDQLFKQFKETMNNHDFVEDLAADLPGYIGRIKAQNLAEKLFKELGKDKIVVRKIRYLYRELKQKLIDEKTISDLARMVVNGKKKSVERVLRVIFGPPRGSQLYERYKDQIVEVPSQPCKDSKFINVQNSLQIYEYKEKLLDMEKSLAKTIIVFGLTRCGKSTFLNAIVNFLAEVQIEDNFRYKIIIEDEEDDKSSIQLSSYYVKNSRTGVVYRLIDTPSFGDTGEGNKIEKILTIVKHTFTNQVDSIHSILFLLVANRPRVTAYEQYLFHSIINFFSKDVLPSITYVFTFSDLGRPLVLQSVMDKQNSFGKYWNEISQPKYLQVNNHNIFKKIDVNNKIKLGYWQISLMSMHQLFEKIESTPARSLTMSRQLLKIMDSLRNKMKVNQQRIKTAIIYRQNFYREIEKVIQFQEQIDSNNNFTYTVDIIRYQDLQTDKNITRCVNCLDSNCHENCTFGDGQDKIDCCAFRKGYCQICPGKCHWNVHKNDHKLRVAKVVQQNRGNPIKKNNYQGPCKNLKRSQILINNLTIDLQSVFNTVQVASRQMIEIQRDLLRNQMSRQKPESTIQYLKHLIQNEERDQRPGNAERIKQMNLVVEEMEFFERLDNEKETKEKKKQLMKKYQIDQIKKLLQKASKDVFQKSKDFFSY